MRGTGREVIDVKFRALPSWRRGRGEGPRIADRPDRRRVRTTPEDAVLQSSEALLDFLHPPDEIRKLVR
jgi:hypothetical protein